MPRKSRIESVARDGAVALVKLAGRTKPNMRACAHRIEGLERRVMLSSAIAAFAPSVTYLTNPVAGLAVADLNGDGKLDLAMVATNKDRVQVFLGNGNGTFQSPTSFAVGSAPSRVAVGDVNGDGRTDLVVTNTGYSTVSVLLGNGNGTFAAHQTFVGVPLMSSLALADINGDGKLDVVVGTASSGSMGLLMGNGDGTFAAAKTFGGIGGFTVAVADVNGDGKLDLVSSASASASGDTVRVQLGNGDGKFGPRQTYSVGPVGLSNKFLCVSDVNGDGHADIVVANRGNVGVLLGTGDGTFANQQTFATDTNLGNVVVCDVNGDGRADLVVGGATSSGSVARHR